MAAPKVGTGVIVRRDGKVLIGKRKGSHATGKWGFTGGDLERGEALEECARRETREETGIEIQNVEIATVTNDIFDEHTHYVTVFLTADHAEGEVELREPEKFEDWVWREWGDLPEPLMLPIENLLERGFDPFDPP